jgi:hypothetical protein
MIRRLVYLTYKQLAPIILQWATTLELFSLVSSLNTTAQLKQRKVGSLGLFLSKLSKIPASFDRE